MSTITTVREGSSAGWDGLDRARASAPHPLGLRQWESKALTLLPVCLIGVAAISLVFTRMILLTQGFWGDESFSVVHYISGGPGSIFGGTPYSPNDHMLFELLAWATTGVLRTHIEANYRIWAVLPAIAAVFAMTWWVWQRVGRWSAAISAVLAAAAPNYLELSWQARGYGLGFLAGAMITIGGDGLLWRPSRKSIALFAGGGLIGILTLPDFVLPFLTVAAVLATTPRLRGMVIMTVVAVGLISIVWYAPVLSSLVSSSRQQFGAQLPWYGFVVNPLKDQVAPVLRMVWPGLSLSAAAAVAAGVTAVGALSLWRVPERFLALLLLAPAFITYLILEIGRLYVADRFVSFVCLPLLAAGAIGLVAIGRALTLGPRLIAAATMLAATCASLFVLGRSVQVASSAVRLPLEAANQIAAVIHGTTPSLPVLTNSRRTTGFRYYLGDRPLTVLTPGALVKTFCSPGGAFLYIDDTNRSPHADTSCLTARGGFQVSVPEQRANVSLWFIPASKH